MAADGRAECPTVPALWAGSSSLHLVLMPEAGRAASPTHSPLGFPPCPLRPHPQSRLPRWLQLKGFVLFPFSQNKPPCAELLLPGRAGCGPAWLYDRPPRCHS